MIVDRIKAHGLRDGSFVVIGSGIMDALGLRTARDIDLVVTPDYFEELRAADGWAASVRHGEEVLEKEDLEVWLSWGSNGRPNFEELYDGGVMIGGLKFTRPEFVLNWKRQHQGEKNDRDARILQDYLEAHA